MAFAGFHHKVKSERKFSLHPIQAFHSNYQKKAMNARGPINRIVLVAAIAAIAPGWQTRLHAGTGSGFIHPGEQQVHPDTALKPSTFDHLIPTTFPLIHPGEPTVKAGGNPVRPVEFSLVPSGAP